MHKECTLTIIDSPSGPRIRVDRGANNWTSFPAEVSERSICDLLISAGMLPKK